jgi:hypothetical protein
VDLAQMLSLQRQRASTKRKCTGDLSGEAVMDYRKYPTNWSEISFDIRANRANWHCEKCGAENGQPNPLTGKIVVLTVAHLGIDRPDGTPGNKYDTMDCRHENLMAMCQRCHLEYDRDDHIRSAARTRFRNRNKRREEAGQLTLFDLPVDYD